MAQRICLGALGAISPERQLEPEFIDELSAAIKEESEILGMFLKQFMSSSQSDFDYFVENTEHFQRRMNEISEACLMLKSLKNQG